MRIPVPAVTNALDAARHQLTEKLMGLFDHVLDERKAYYAAHPDEVTTPLDIPRTHNGVTDTYTYDWQGLRTRASFNGTYTRYLYDGERVLEELNDAGASLVRYTVENGSYSGMLLHFRHHTGEDRFPMYDSIGSVRGLVDSTGTVTDLYELDTFGEEVSSSGSTPSPCRFGAAWGCITDTASSSQGSGLLRPMPRAVGSRGTSEESGAVEGARMALGQGRAQRGRGTAGNRRRMVAGSYRDHIEGLTWVARTPLPTCDFAAFRTSARALVVYPPAPRNCLQCPLRCSEGSLDDPAPGARPLFRYESCPRYFGQVLARNVLYRSVQVTPASVGKSSVTAVG